MKRLWKGGESPHLHLLLFAERCKCTSKSLAWGVRVTRMKVQGPQPQLGAWTLSPQEKLARRREDGEIQLPEMVA